MLKVGFGRGEREVVRGVEGGGPSVLFSAGGKGVLRARGREWDVREGFVFFVGVEVEVESESKGEGGDEGEGRGRGC